jgi:hypothetical protein
MADIDDLKTIKTQIIALLKDLTVNPKPSYDLDGQKVSWAEYQKMLFDRLDGINKLIASDEPFELHTQGFT